MRMDLDKLIINNSFFMNYYQLFVIANFQSMLISMNIVYISEHKIVPMLVTGFLLSLLWTLTIKKLAFGDWVDRFVYATGATVGTAAGYLISTKYII